MSEIKKGAFVRWTAEDEKGSFSHVGQVVSFRDGFISMDTGDGGAMGFHVTDGSVEVTRKPKAWGIVKTEEPKAETKKPVVAVTRSNNGGGKLDLIVTLLRANPPTSRKDAIEKIVAAGISTPAGASTYYNTAKSML